MRALSESSTLPASEPLRGSCPQSEDSVSRRCCDPEPCPVCGNAVTHEWLRAPDRLHGRSELYTLVSCGTCSLVWLSNPPRPTDMHLHYTDAYHRLISASGNDPAKRWMSRKEDLMRHKRSGKLLDLGCSSGSFLKFMGNESWSPFGIEMSAECAKAAEARCGAQVFVGDILDAAFPPESFDAITCFDVLEHLYQPREVMRKLGEWLRPGGVVYIQVPNIESAEARVFGRYWHGLELPRHLFHYSVTSLRALAKSAQLTEVWLTTRRNPAVGTGLRYVFDDLFSRIGIRRTPVAYRAEPSILWKAGRKLVRMTALRILLEMAPLLGSGESIHGIFTKSEQKVAR